VRGAREEDRIQEPEVRSQNKEKNKEEKKEVRR